MVPKHPFYFLKLGGKGNRSPAPSLLVNILVLSDVVIFLQENSQKYNFVTPEGKSGVVPVHTLIAREKPGSDNKALYLISTSDTEPEMYEIQASKIFLVKLLPTRSS